jgi:ubiquinone/menaquinone biosynthesis C-methylase UbiE
MSGFKDHFSRQSTAYSLHRPGYPVELIGYVASRAPDRTVAVDCATGNGQAAVQFAEHFDVVLAVDGSHSQLTRARKQARVHYATALAESLPVRTACASLIVAAQAAHWFDFDRYYAECRRALKPGGIVAAWTYQTFRIDPRIDASIGEFYSGEVGPYWPPERVYVEQGYRTLPFPLAEEAAPRFELETDWTLEQVMGYLATWSSVQRYKDARGLDPLPPVEARLRKLWPDGEPRRVRWPIYLRIGRV